MTDPKPPGGRGPLLRIEIRDTGDQYAAELETLQELELAETIQLCGVMVETVAIGLFGRLTNIALFGGLPARELLRGLLSCRDELEGAIGRALLHFAELERQTKPSRARRRSAAAARGGRRRPS